MPKAKVSSGDIHQKVHRHNDGITKDIGPDFVDISHFAALFRNAIVRFWKPFSVFFSVPGAC